MPCSSAAISGRQHLAPRMLLVDRAAISGGNLRDLVKKRVFAKLSSVRHATAPTDPKHGRIVQRQMKDQPVTTSAAIQQSSPA